MLLTVLGEFVLPSGGSAWTSTLVSAAGTLGIAEKNARQALTRIADQGLIESSRHGRRVRWGLTADGRALLETGTERIYSFGSTFVGWNGEWLMVHCPVPEERRALRNQLRTRLSFLGFGELSPSLVISPHVERERALRDVLDDLGLLDHSTVLRSTTSSSSDDADLAAGAWDLDLLAADYRSFSDEQRRRRPSDGAGMFEAVVGLVHDWRRFAFADPELPSELLPPSWAGTTAASDFHELHDDWSPAARNWYEQLEAPERVAV